MAKKQEFKPIVLYSLLRSIKHNPTGMDRNALMLRTGLKAHNMKKCLDYLKAQNIVETIGIRRGMKYVRGKEFDKAMQ